MLAESQEISWAQQTFEVCVVRRILVVVLCCTYLDDPFFENVDGDMGAQVVVEEVGGLVVVVDPYSPLDWFEVLWLRASVSTVNHAVLDDVHRCMRTEVQFLPRSYLQILGPVYLIGFRNDLLYHQVDILLVFLHAFLQDCSTIPDIVSM